MEEDVRQVGTMEGDVEDVPAVGPGPVEERRNDPGLIDLEHDGPARRRGRTRARSGARPADGQRALGVQRESRAEAELYDEFPGRTACDHPPTVEQDHPIAQALRLL